MLKIKNSKKYFLFLLLTFFLASCFSVTYKDISSDPRYKDIIGTKYNTKVDLLVLGIVLHLKNKDHVDFYTITTLPGFSGPEVIYESSLKKGAILEVVGVEVCTMCLPDRMHYLVKIINDDHNYSANKVRIKSGTDNYSMDKETGVGMLNPVIYSRVE